MTIFEMLTELRRSQTGTTHTPTVMLRAASTGAQYADLQMDGNHVGSIRFDPTHLDVEAITLMSTTPIAILRRLQAVLPANIPIK